MFIKWNQTVFKFEVYNIQRGYIRRLVCKSLTLKFKFILELNPFLFSFSDIVVKYPKFMGTGYMAFPVLRGAYKEFTITINFRPDTGNGLLMFSSEHENAVADFFSISLVDGFAEFRY